jgi:hypothetical protein
MHTMSKITYRIDKRSFDDTIADNEAGWSSFKEVGRSRTAAFDRFEDLEREAMQQELEPQYRIVAILAPCNNAPIHEVCQSGYGTQLRCERDAVVDAPNETGRWGYWCLDHWAGRGYLAFSLANVITAKPLELVLVES